MRDTIHAMNEYRVLLAPNLQELSEAVKDLMKQGWRPQGGVVIDKTLFYQAMVR
jgi:hypothetical protein